MNDAAHDRLDVEWCKRSFFMMEGTFLHQDRVIATAADLRRSLASGFSTVHHV